MGINKLEKWKKHEFSSGIYAGEDFLMFSREFKKYLKEICKNTGFELIKFNRGHYDISAFIKKNDNYLYISVPDVRFNSFWHENVLIRKAKDETDYIGKSNHFVRMDDLEEAIMTT